MTLRLDFTNQDYFRDPAAGLERLRRAGPVVEIKFPIVGKVWLTTNYELAGRVLKDSGTFSLRKNGGVAGLRWWMPRTVRALANNMLTMDEPDHTRLRGIVDEAFRRHATSTWSRASWQLPIGSPQTSLPMEVRPISSIAMRGGCHSPSFANCSDCRRPTERNSRLGQRAPRESPARSPSGA
jgi:hypothetical protein